MIIESFPLIIEGERQLDQGTRNCDRQLASLTTGKQFGLKWNQEFTVSIQLIEESGGKAVVVKVSGKLVRADYEHFVPEFERLVREHGKLHILFDMADFHGWEGGALWEDIKFDVKHFADIDRLAMVGDKKWQHGMATFFKPFTKAISRYFDQANAAEARKWLDEP